MEPAVLIFNVRGEQPDTMFRIVRQHALALKKNGDDDAAAARRFRGDDDAGVSRSLPRDAIVLAQERTRP